jgi:hypothetical protein
VKSEVAVPSKIGRVKERAAINPRAAKIEAKSDWGIGIG